MLLVTCYLVTFGWRDFEIILQNYDWMSGWNNSLAKPKVYNMESCGLDNCEFGFRLRKVGRVK